MSVSRKTSADVTPAATSTETDISTITDAGVYELNADLNTLANGETLIYRVYGKTRNGGTERLRYEWRVKHAQHKKQFTSLPISNVDYARFTVEQQGGSVRTIPTSIYQLDA